MNQDQVNAFSDTLESTIVSFKSGLLFVNKKETIVKGEDLIFRHKSMKKYNALLDNKDLHAMITNLAHMWGVHNCDGVVQHIINAVRGMAPYASNKNVTMKLLVSDPLVVDMKGIRPSPPYPHITILWKMGGDYLYNIFVSVTWICMLVKSGLLISFDGLSNGSEAYIKIPITEFLVHSAESKYAPGKVSNSVGLVESDSLVQLIGVFRKAFPESEPLYMENQVHLKVKVEERHIVDCVANGGERFVLLSPYLTNSSAPKNSKWLCSLEEVLPGYKRCEI